MQDVLRDDKVVSADKVAIDTARGLILDAILGAGGGHSGAPIALLPAAYVLWTRFLHFDPKFPDWARRDRVVLSNGHACMLQYTALHLTGYDVTVADLKGLRAQGSLTPGHPEYRHTPGVEVTTGPLGQGVANAIGMALGNVLEDRRSDQSQRPRKTWVFAGDGCLMEGVASEASSLAGQWGLADLIMIYDDNGITIDARTSDTFAEDVDARYRAYGWDVVTVADGNDVEALAAAFEHAVAAAHQPTLVHVKTRAADGVPGLEDTLEAHGGVLEAATVAAAKSGWGLDPEQFFVVPDAVYESWRVRRSVEEDTSVTIEPADLTKLDAIVDGLALPRTPVATRESSSAVLNQLAAALPDLIGGSADVAESSGTWLFDEGAFSVDPGGRNILYGVREFAMGAITNGLVIQGRHRAFTGTFLAFADYMRPSMRLAALMGVPSIFVFSHDSVALGADGPTHQPVEQLNSLRDIPNLHVIRPADAAEVAEAWRLALHRTNGPTAIVLTRQTVGVDHEAGADVDQTTPPDNLRPLSAAAGLARGAYSYEAESPDSDLDVLLLATGSEVSVATAAQRVLARDGINARVVSMPCWDAFGAEDETYRQQVLPPSVTARVSIEAGVTSPWHRWVGPSGELIGVDRFGACTRGVETWLEYGFTVNNVVEHARRAVAKTRA